MRQSSIPLTIEELTPDWLTEAMRAAGALDGRVTSVAAQRMGIGAGYVAQVLRVHLEYKPAGAGPASIVAKLPGASEELRRSWWAGYINEWRFYRDLARSVPLSTPRYLGGAGDAGDVAHGLAVTLLEDFDAASTGDQIVGASLVLSEAVVDALARLHAAFWTAERPPSEETAWLANDPALHAQALSEYARSGAPHIARYVRDNPSVPPAFVERAATLPEAIATASLRLADAPQTLVHGDMRPENLLLRDAEDQRAFVTIDWQGVAINAGAYDVAYFLGQSLEPDLRRAYERPLLTRYLDALVAGGVEGYSADDLWRDYRLALVVTLFSPIGWAGELRTAEGLRDLDGPTGEIARGIVEHGVPLLRVLAARNYAAVEETGAFALL